MKKILATVLCLAIAAPCFAKPPRHHFNRPPRHPHYEYRYDYHYNHRCGRECSSYHRTRTFATIAGVAGLATVISAIID